MGSDTVKWFDGAQRFGFTLRDEHGKDHSLYTAGIAGEALTTNLRPYAVLKAAHTKEASDVGSAVRPLP
jgi:hypothetical protein